MWLPLLGLVLGIVLGLFTEFRIPTEYSNYLSIAILAALDTLFGGIRAQLQNIYDELVFVSGFFFNILLAASLAFLGVHLGVDLYLVAMFAFGVRLFQNIAVIRRILISKWSLSREKLKKN
ncbi:small basic family protein [Metabacillus fastidiosus]|uniref:Small basic family protein n=1 Tax=Metabacillus fastidiosus TaxID=1458 RepID=A0ABU6NX03_9BACI|nr:small basic family protein [Metabacillus fastidiosus]MEC2074691.1 small basic family protein [Metabacillus fastidiosus]MED4401663.1 small basic family protein [Metabacillus fastidiosus]MED4452777.1 small basic family protein [Metabacillus fastidiosus]MED4463302.1 small basic family protein [Metabacillus fastidiosus]MED4532645.1 small basic family protein [Metabacillus fastidiosus]